MIKWLKKFFSEDNSKLKRLSGRASCTVCNKKLEDNIFTVPNSEYYYCKKHAKERLHGLHTTQDKKKPLSSESKNNYHICKKCDKRLFAWENKFKFCTVCGDYYCKDHFHNHRCSPKQPQDVKIKIKTPPSKKCYYCKKNINTLNRFSCKYCQKWFCDEHRLPEDHKCKGKVKNPHKYSGRFNYSKYGTEYYVE